jgi:hypothetical protein
MLSRGLAKYHEQQCENNQILRDGEFKRAYQYCAQKISEFNLSKSDNRKYTYQFNLYLTENSLPLHWGDNFWIGVIKNCCLFWESSDPHNCTTMAKDDFFLKLQMLEYIGYRNYWALNGWRSNDGVGLGLSGCFVLSLSWRPEKDMWEPSVMIAATHTGYWHVYLSSVTPIC